MADWYKRSKPNSFYPPQLTPEVRAGSWWQLFELRGYSTGSYGRGGGDERPAPEPVVQWEHDWPASATAELDRRLKGRPVIAVGKSGGSFHERWFDGVVLVRAFEGEGTPADDAARDEELEAMSALRVRWNSVPSYEAKDVRHARSATLSYTTMAQVARQIAEALAVSRPKGDGPYSGQKDAPPDSAARKPAPLDSAGNPPPRPGEDRDAYYQRLIDLRRSQNRGPNEGD